MRMIRQRMECVLSTLPAQVLSWMCSSSRCSNSSFKVSSARRYFNLCFMTVYTCNVKFLTRQLAYALTVWYCKWSFISILEICWHTSVVMQFSVWAQCFILLLLLVGLLVLMNNKIFEKCQSLFLNFTDIANLHCKWIITYWFCLFSLKWTLIKYKYSKLGIHIETRKWNKQVCAYSHIGHTEKHWKTYINFTKFSLKFSLNFQRNFYHEKISLNMCIT